MNVYGFLLLMLISSVVGAILFWGESYWNSLPDIKCHHCGRWDYQGTEVCKNCCTVLIMSTKEEEHQ